MTQNQINDADLRSPYPKFKGKTLHEIASTPEGLIYLDWLVGWLDEKDVGDPQRNYPFYSSLKRYLQRPEIGRAVDEAIEKRDSGKDDDVPGAWHPPGVNKPWWEK